MSAKILRFDEAEYPPRLRDLRQPPPAVYVTGEIPRGPAVAIVGTRTPTDEAIQYTKRLAGELVEAGVAVFSGGAAGIDTAAHRGTLDAGGLTLVAAPSSFEHPHPGENAALFRDVVAAGGCYLTPFGPGTHAALPNFFARNAVLAALAQALVVVETRFRGGARNAARAARELSRPVLVVPGPPWNGAAMGCLLEIRNGARMVLSVRDILEALRAVPSLGPRESGPRVERAEGGREALRPGLPKRHRPRHRKTPARGSDPERDLVVSALESGAGNSDEVCRRTGLPASRVQALLLTLTLEGIVVSGPSGRLSLVNV